VVFVNFAVDGLTFSRSGATKEPAQNALLTWGLPDFCHMPLKMPASVGYQMIARVLIPRYSTVQNELQALFSPKPESQ
jgi:hypothetical protein